MRYKLGGKFWTGMELEDNPDVPRAAFVSEEAIGERPGAITGGFLFLGSAIAMTRRSPRRLRSPHRSAPP